MNTRYPLFSGNERRGIIAFATLMAIVTLICAVMHYRPATLPEPTSTQTTAGAADTLSATAKPTKPSVGKSRKRKKKRPVAAKRQYRERDPLSEPVSEN